MALNSITSKREVTDNDYDMEVKYFKRKLEETGNNLTQIIIDHIEKLIETTNSNIEDNTNTYTSNFGLELKRLGSSNINMINLVYGFLTLNNEKVNTAIGLSELFPFLLRVFEAYPWNNVFHCIFMKIFDLYLKCEADSPLFTNVSIYALVVYSIIYDTQ